MPNRVIERAYESIRGYVPEDAKQVLSDQVEAVEKYVDTELEKFAEELSQYIGEEVSKEMAKLEQSFSTTSENIQKQLDIIAADVTSGDDELAAAVNRLREEQAKINAKFEGAGEIIRKSVVNAARSAGLPLPNL